MRDCTEYNYSRSTQEIWGLDLNHFSKKYIKINLSFFSKKYLR